MIAITPSTPDSQIGLVREGRLLILTAGGFTVDAITGPPEQLDRAEEAMRAEFCPHAYSVPAA